MSIIRYIIGMKGECSFEASWIEGHKPCTRWATRFERWDGGDFSISCKEHHKVPSPL